ncbi:MAG: M1 family metallopeptidase [Bacteroidales bacterium]|nr:M1 family metallopeptidase [Bacteroidales bacterium]
MKNKSIFLTTFIALLSVLQLTAQEKRFFMPVEIKKAYDNETRSYDGKPGVKYWQNTADYTIDVKVNVDKKYLEGKENVIYYNNSPNDLNTIMLRLYYDAYKKGNIRGIPVKKEDLSDGVELKSIIINGDTVDLKNEKKVWRYGTNMSIRLNDLLKSGEKLNLKVVWKQGIPATNRRSGVYDSTTFFIGQWYPQVAVYDDLFGWDHLNFDFNTEFYNNLANFDVKISLPENFAVWATGTFENAQEVLPENIYTKYKKAQQSEEPVHVIDASDLKSGFKTLNNTWHYTAREVSDFGFGLSNHYCWDAISVPIGNKKVLVSSAYPSFQADKYKEHVKMQGKVMTHFSNDFPGIPYPYEAFTTFIGLHGGGMEYPMLANNASQSTGLAIHEMFHTYFPMYVRINERRWAWMDEGWAEYGTTIVNNRYFKNKNDFEDVFSEENVSDYGLLGTVEDLPLIVSSQFMDESNYGYASYPLPANVYGILHQYLGEELFMKCYREYIRRWAKKSPSPYDFFYTFENVSGQDLSWIWKPWFFEFGYPDVDVQGLKKNKLQITNLGNKPVPLFIEVLYNDSSVQKIEKDASIWKSAKKSIVNIDIPNYKNIDKIFVNKNISDLNSLNNFYPPLKEWYAKINLPEDILGDYILSINGLSFSFFKENGIIYVKFKGWGKSALYPVNSTTLSSFSENEDYKFIFDENGKCTGVNVGLGDFLLEASKITP